MHVASENLRREDHADLRLWFEAALVTGEWAENIRISVTNGSISEIERNVARQPGDEKCSVGIPGLANLHSHSFQRGMSALTEKRGPAADSFWTWRQLMYRFLDRLTPDDVEAITAQAYVEMLESGWTRVGEFQYLHHDIKGVPYDDIGELAARICGAAHATGINLTLLPTFYAHSGFGAREPEAGQRRFITSLDQFADLMESAARSAASVPGATLGVAPHSLRAVTADELNAIVALSRNLPIHIHVAEQQKEVEDCIAATGQRPVEWLLANASVDARWCLIHATHMTPDEVAAVAKSGATVGLCPLTEANLGDGIFPAPSFLSHGGCFGIGSDSNVNIGAAAELCMLEYAQRLARRGRNVLARGPGASTGRSLFDAALLGGNRALGVRADGLAVGNSADIVTLTCDHESLAPPERGDAMLDRFIFGAKDRWTVDRVWVGGRRVVAGGQHFRHQEISARYRSSLQRLLST